MDCVKIAKQTKTAKVSDAANPNRYCPEKMDDRSAMIWVCSSIWESIRLASGRSWVRLPSDPPGIHSRLVL